MLDANALEGLFIPVITPFLPNQKLDLTSYERYIGKLLQENIQGLVVNGTTGESPTVAWEEVESLFQLTRKQAATTRNLSATARSLSATTRSLSPAKSPRMPIVIGTGTNDTASSIRRTELAGKLGADAALVVVPYYSRPSQEGIYEHFRQISSVGVPVIAYEIPSRTGIRTSVGTMRRIMDLDGVIGLKDSSGGIELISELTRHESKPILCGDDSFFYTKLCLGASGGILASANVNTEIFSEVWNSFQKGSFVEARTAFDSLTELIALLFEEPNPAPIKWLLAKNGLIDSDQLRLPMTPISAALREKLEAALYAM
ncbi:4-hydroxy-tetrahydrodipicolinate synthase [Paenibacillus sp. HB172176]|uniref:4-hydroxy-tetrahydrodipicolinate synthase n=1 Tax=Paenibacillus sp. HB172176 TaxID=2493690 RepID=UPI00143888FE|nr:4-hydroxy-tetrahydrodipicolinate synthase [Paenibacillus sp. HB172176]